MPRVFPFAERSRARLPDRLAGRSRNGQDESRPDLTPRDETESGSPDGLTLADVGRLLRRRWLVILLPTLAAFGLAVVFVQVVTPRYTAETKLLLESRDSALTRLQQDRGELPQPIDEQAVASQVQVVMSRDIAREAIKSLGLVGNPEFDPMVKGVGASSRCW